MYFAKYGSGQNVFVGFHGWSGDHRTFEPLVKYLPENVTFYSADLPGIGNSPSPKEDTLQQVITEIIDGLCSLQAPAFTILGSCSGGLIGLFVAKYLQEAGREKELKRLILIDPFAYFPWYFKVFVSPQIGKIGWYAYCTTFANPVGRWITNMSLHKRRTEEAHLTSSFTEVNHRITYKYLQLLAEGGIADQFSAVSTPVVILYGEKTFNVVHESVRIWQRILPKVISYELKGTGHLPIVEAPNELARRLF
jgi:pimeloyl-ACP methyl ester carboxylesterase